MAKKGGVQQLQAEINTDEEFDKLLERAGLIVCDVYSEWCGPCLGMVGSLKKIKLELGGDNLHLAVCKSDTISYLKRFNKKSEPTWLFIVKGKAVNLMFGTNVPKLMKMITNELNMLSAKTARESYEITQLQPEEQERKKLKDEAEAEAIRIEMAEKDKKRRNYLYSVTDNIMENLGDIGVSVFGPQVSRDMFKKINEPAEHLKMQCKDRKYTTVMRENFDLVNLLCSNHLSDDILGQLDQHELLICFWKMPEGPRRPIVEMMNTYVQYLTTTRTEPPEVPGAEERKFPAVIFPMDIKLDTEEGASEISETAEPVKPVEIKEEEITLLQEEVDEEGEEGPEGGLGEGLNLDFDMDVLMDEEETRIDELEISVETPKKRTHTRTITIPPVWVPNTHRAHAALVYVFFRNQTVSFLPPDPVPEPPHVIMAFDAYKKKDLLDLYARHREEVPYYGFFTTDDVSDAKLISTNIEGYLSKPAQPTDKIIFRVNKQTSHIMLAFANFGPSYISANTVVGKEESNRLFPDNYYTMEDELKEEEEASKKKKKKAKKDKEEKKDSVAVSEEVTPVTTSAEGATPEGAAAEPASTEAGTPTTSGEESGESMPPQGEAAAAGTEAAATAEGTATAEATPAGESAPAAATEAAATEAAPAEATAAATEPTAETAVPTPESPAAAEAAAPATEPPAEAAAPAAAEEAPAQATAEAAPAEA